MGTEAERLLLSKKHIFYLSYDAQRTKGPFMQSANNKGPDPQANQGLRCPLAQSINTVVYVDEQRRP